MKTALILEGGAMRGIYTAGVLDVLMEHHIMTDGVFGVSAGAIHAASMLSGQKGRNIRYYKEYCADPRFMSWKSFFTTGSLVGEKFCYEELPDRLDPFDYETFRKNAEKMEFYAVCTNLESGEAEYVRMTDMKTQMDALRASASMPYVSPIVKVNGEKLLDGGVADSIPIAAARRMGFEKNIVVLTQVRDYVKKPSSMRAFEWMYLRYPKFMQSLKHRHEVYNKERRVLAALEKKGQILVICPSEELHIGRMEKDPDRLQMMYDLGRADAVQKLSEIRKFLNLPDEEDGKASDGMDSLQEAYPLWSEEEKNRYLAKKAAEEVWKKKIKPAASRRAGRKFAERLGIMEDGRMTPRSVCRGTGRMIRTFRKKGRMGNRSSRSFRGGWNR